MSAAPTRYLAKPLKCAFFVGAIATMFIAVTEANAVWIDCGIEREGITNDQNTPTKSSYVLFSIGQSVKIPCPTPQIEKFCATLDIYDVLGSKRGPREVGYISSAAGHFWPQHAGTRHSNRVKLCEIEKRRYGCLAEKSVTVKSESASWGIPAVLPRDAHPPIKISTYGIWFVKGIQSACENEGSLVCDEGVTAQFSLLNANNNQTSGNQGQESGKDGDINISDFEIAIIALRPFLFFIFAVGITVSGNRLYAAGKQNAKYQRCFGLILVCSSPFVFVYGFWGLL